MNLNTKFSPKTEIDVPPQVKVIMNRKPEQKNRIYTYKVENENLKNNEINTLSCFTAVETGYYIISSQISVEANDVGELNFLQYGVCDEEFANYLDCFESEILNIKIEKEHIISKNLCSTKYLEKGKKYVLWSIYVADIDLTLKDYSNLKLIQI